MGKLDELEKLARLKKNGTITQKEFQEMKKNILDDSLDDDRPNRRKNNQSSEVEERPQPTAKITDAYVWIVAVAPIALTVLLYSMGIFDGSWTSFYIWIIFNTVFCAIDEDQVRKAYHTQPNLWYFFLVPVYLYKRSTVVGDNRAYFWTWLVCFILSIL